MSNSDLNLLNYVPCSIFSFTDEGTLSYLNDPLLNLLQYSREELTGQKVEKMLTVSSRIFYQTHFFPLITLQGEVNEIFLTLLSKNKSAVPVLLNASRKNDGAGNLNICACITVSERKKYEDEILHAKKTAEDALHKNELLQKTKHELELGKQELDKQLTQLKYTNEELLQLNEVITHDLQEPVRKISLYVDLVANDKEVVYKERTLNSLRIISSSVTRIRDLLQSLQNYLPILTKPVQKTPVDLNACVNDNLKELRDKNPVLVFEVTLDNLPIINADEGQMKILFCQLLKNCVDFRNTERNLHIQITASVTEENFYNSMEGKYKYVEFVRVSIADNGMGFNPLYKDLIFKILKRLNYKKKGIGLGLAFCKRIAENHRGYIRAHGEEGQGARFVVVLPFN